MTRRLTRSALSTRVLAAGALVLVGIGGTVAGAHAESSLQCDSTYANWVFPDALSFTPKTADASGSGTVTGTDYSLQYSWSFDFTTKQATVDATVTSTKYWLTATNVWYVRTPDDGGLPIGDNYSNTPVQTRHTVVSFDLSDFKSLYAISWTLRPCTTGSPETTAAGSGGTDAPGTSGGASGSGSGLPATGSDAVSIALWAVLLAAAGGTVAFTARRPRRTTR